MKKILLKHYDIKDFYYKTRKTQYREARQIYCWLKYYYTHESTIAIGAEVHRDHSTVSISVRKTNERIATSWKFAEFISKIVSEVNLPVLYPNGRDSIAKVSMPYPAFKTKPEANTLVVEVNTLQRKSSKFLELSRALATQKRRKETSSVFSDIIDAELKIKELLQEIKAL